MRLRVLVLALLAPLATAVLVTGALAGDGDGKRKMPRQRLQGVNFISSCGFSHRAPDDPIVFPGRPGASHDHSFVGNRTTNASSTLGSLLAGQTTCRNRPGDTAGYWMPTLYVGSQAVAPLGATIYYRRKSMRHVQAFPPGFRMIAGDATATTAAAAERHVLELRRSGGIRPQSTPPSCPDGRGTCSGCMSTSRAAGTAGTSTATNHKSHVAYPERGRCPSRYPVALPAISLIYRYPTLGGPAARSPPAASTPATATSSTRGTRTRCSGSSTPA